MKLLISLLTLIQLLTSFNHVQTLARSRYALLVGINNYPGLGKDFRLHACVNDVSIMHDLLIHWDWQAKNIQALTDSMATKRNIVAAFNCLVDSVKNDDIVVIYFSCHGSQVRDLTNKEQDGLNETLIPYDYKNTIDDARASSIVDVELDSLLNVLTSITQKVTVILDACHSAGATRDISPFHGKFVPPLLTNSDSVEIAKIRQQFEQEDNAGYQGLNARYTLITSCQSQEVSNEYFPPSDSAYSALTYFLVRELRIADSLQTWPDVIGRVTSNVLLNFPDQTPQLGGDNADGIIFGDNIHINHAFFYVSPTKGSLVVVNAGRSLGLAKGSIYEVFPPGTIDFDQAKSIGRIRITVVKSSSSEATIVKGEVPALNCKARESQHTFISSPLNVVFKGNWSSTTLKRMRSTVLAIPSVLESKLNPYIMLHAQKGVIRFALAKDTSIGLGTMSMAQAAHDSTLVKEILRWRKWFHVLQINNNASQIKFTAHLEKDVKTRSITDRLIHPDYVFEDGERVELTVTNLSTVPLYFHVLDLMDNGKIAAYTFGHLGKLLSNDKIFPNESRSVSFPVWVRKNMNTSRDVMKIYAVTDPKVSFEYLSQEGAPVPPNTIAKVLTRDLDETLAPVDDWAILSKILLIKKEAP